MSQNQLYRFIPYDPANPPNVGRHWCRVFDKPERLFFGNDGKWTMPYGSIPIEAEISYLSPVSIEPESGVLRKALERIRDNFEHDDYGSNAENCPVCIADAALSSTEENNVDELWNRVVAEVATADIVKSVKPEDVGGIIGWKKTIINKLKQQYLITKK